MKISFFLLAILTAAALAQPSAPITDSRDGKTYRTVKIGEQVWMAENLDYAAKGSKCYENEAEYCAKYGRLYNWETAKKACPDGWHLPNSAEWKVIVGNKFAALKGGFGFAAVHDKYFFNDGYNGYWWSSTEKNYFYAYSRQIIYNREGLGSSYFTKTTLLSVRCARD